MRRTGFIFSNTELAAGCGKNKDVLVLWLLPKPFCQFTFSVKLSCSLAARSQLLFPNRTFCLNLICGTRAPHTTVMPNTEHQAHLVLHRRGIIVLRWGDTASSSSALCTTAGPFWIPNTTTTFCSYYFSDWTTLFLSKTKYCFTYRQVGHLIKYWQGIQPGYGNPHYLLTRIWRICLPEPLPLQWLDNKMAYGLEMP